MKENVGKQDRIIRSVSGSALITAGYTVLGGRKGKLAGLSAIVLGTLLIESAITKVCPANALLGIDTREKLGPLDKIRKALE